MPKNKFQRFLHLSTQVRENWTKRCYTFCNSNPYHLLLSIFKICRGWQHYLSCSFFFINKGIKQEIEELRHTEILVKINFSSRLKGGDHR